MHNRFVLMFWYPKEKSKNYSEKSLKKNNNLMVYLRIIYYN